MPIVTGKIILTSNGTSKTLGIGDPLLKQFEPPDWVWDLVKGNGGETGVVDYTETPPPESTITINSVTVK